MASGKIFVVFVLPVILSITFASAVMADILEKPDRNLQMWPPQSSVGGHGSGGAGAHSDDGMRITGLAPSYAFDQNIAVRIAVDDASFDCGDLYITIRDSDDGVLTQKAFFSQCFVASGTDLPIGAEFTTTVSMPGHYVLSAELRTEAESVTALGEFVVE